MAFPLTLLPPEVVISHLLHFLGPGDIINLVQCLDLEITKEVYHLAFPGSPQFTHYDRLMFNERMGAKAYYFGVVLDEVDPQVTPPYIEYVNRPDRDRIRRVCAPFKLEAGDGVIVQADVSSRDRRLLSQVVDKSGNLYFLSERSAVKAEIRRRVPDDYAKGRMEGTPKGEFTFEVDRAAVRAARAGYNVRRVDTVENRRAAILTRRAVGLLDRSGWFWEGLEIGGDRAADVQAQAQQREQEEDRIAAEEDRRALVAPGPHEFENDPHNVYFTDSAELREASDRYCEDGRDPVLYQASPGPNIWALDSRGVLWSWDYHQESCGAPLLLQDSRTGDLVGGTIARIHTGPIYNACLIEGRGVVVGPAQQPPTLAPNGWKSGYRCFDDHLCAVHVFTVPGTSAGVRDFHVVDPYCTILLHRDGTLSCVNIDTGCSEFDLGAVNNVGHFVLLAGSVCSFAAVTADGQAVVGNVTPSGRGHTVGWHPVKALEDVHVVSVAVGTHHFLALTDDGDVYTWGLETSYCGCLGLGRLADVVQMPDVAVRDSTISLLRPTKIKLPGKAYGVYAELEGSMVMVSERK